MSDNRFGGTIISIDGIKIDNLPSKFSNEKLEELIENIDKLGDLLGLVKEMANGLENFFRENNDIHSWNASLIILSFSLQKSVDEYTEFHHNFFKYLIENKI